MPTIASSVERDALLADLEGLWRCLDGLVAGVASDEWSGRHGPDWTHADLPYHLAYFDRDLIADGIARGADVPAADRWLMRSLNEIAAWNARQFARRPAAQTVGASLAQMRAARDDVRAAVAGLDDDDLDRPIWIPLFGWRTVRDALVACLAHTWFHTMELRLRLKRATPEPGPSITHRAVGFYAGIVASTLDRDAARDKRLTAVLAFTGPAGGAWTLRVADGRCAVAEGHAADAELVLTQSPATFHATLTRVQNPMLGMLTGKVKARGLRHLPTFGKLFGPPKPDQVLALADDPAPANVPPSVVGTEIAATTG